MYKRLTLKFGLHVYANETSSSTQVAVGGGHTLQMMTNASHSNPTQTLSSTAVLCQWRITCATISRVIHLLLGCFVSDGMHVVALQQLSCQLVGSCWCDGVGLCSSKLVLCSLHAHMASFDVLWCASSDFRPAVPHMKILDDSTSGW